MGVREGGHRLTKNGIQPFYSDINERAPTFRQAQKYRENGNQVYSYFLDAETQWDGIIGGKPRFPGTGHGHDVGYVFGDVRDARYPYYNNGLQPEDWEYDVTFLFESQWTRFNHRGEPWINWEPMGDEFETLVIGQGTVIRQKFQIFSKYSRFFVAGIQKCQKIPIMKV